MADLNKSWEQSYQEARNHLQSHGYLTQRFPNPSTPPEPLSYIISSEITMDVINDYLVDILTHGPKEIGTNEEKNTRHDIRTAARTLMHQALSNENELA